MTDREMGGDEVDMDPDLFMDMPAQHGHGGAFGDYDLDDPFRGSIDQDDSNESGYLLDERYEEEDSVPVRRRGASSQSTNSYLDTATRHSLAFELASAAEAPSGMASLMAELGIEEEGEGEYHGQLGVDRTQEGQEYEDSGLLSRPFSPTQPSTNAQVNPSNSPGSPKHVSHSRTPTRQARSRPSRASLHPSPSTQTLQASSSANPLASFSEDDERQKEDLHAAAFSQLMDTLDTTRRSTDDFLRHLQAHNGTITTQEEDVGGRSTSLPTYHDRQPVAEQLASGLIKSLYELAKQREEHSKELKETEKLLLDEDPAWQSALADLDPLPAYAGSTRKRIEPNGRLDTLEETGEEDERLSSSSSSDAGPPTPTEFDDLPVASTSFHDLPGVLASLRSTTDALVHSLSTIAEHTQVSKAAYGDVSRKLKSIQAFVTSWKAETESLERSQVHIRQWEERELSEGNPQDRGLKRSALPGLEPRRRKTSSTSNSSRTSTGSNRALDLQGTYSAKVSGELEAAMSVLESSHASAKQLLDITGF